MKLSSLYTPSAHEIPNNGLYGHYQQFFLDGLREPDERKPFREKITSDKYEYEIGDKEEEFYERFYVPQGNILEAENHVFLEDLFDKLEQKAPFGEHIKDLVDFIDQQKNLGLLIAPIGWGKTVLNRYMWLYLTSKSSQLQERIIPIYISTDHQNIFRNGGTSNDIRNAFYKEILHERLVNVVQKFTDLDNEQFWHYLMKGSDRFNTLEQYEADINRIYKTNNKKRMQKIYKARKTARTSAGFYLVALKYIREVKFKIPILILDNIDTLPLEVNQVILEEMIYLSQEYGLKAILSMRTPTYQKIMETRDGLLRAYPPLNIRMEKPNVLSYLARRTESIRQAIRDAKPQFKYINYQGNIRVSFDDGLKVFDAMLEILIGEESLNILSYVTNHNLRKINTLVLRYLTTGFIDEAILVKKIIHGELSDEKYYKSPLWILLSSVITNNHKTRFSQVGMSYQEGVLNLYCNGRRDPKEYLIRLHILNYVKRHREAQKEEIISLYSEFGNGRDLRANMSYAIFRLLSFELLDSPECYNPMSPDDIDLKVKVVSITETGDYYRQELRNYYEYLVYMKDDVELIENDYGIQDCIKVADMRGRLREVLKFLKLLHSTEKNFLFKLNRDQRINFAENFSIPEDSGAFIVTAPVTKIVSFCKAKLEDSNTELIQEYEELNRQVIEDVESFRKSIA